MDSEPLRGIKHVDEDLVKKYIQSWQNMGILANLDKQAVAYGTIYLVNLIGDKKQQIVSRAEGDMTSVRESDK